MKVKILPSPELGEPKSLNLFGQEIGLDYTKVDFDDDQVAKVRGNRFFHIEGDPLDHAAYEQVRGLAERRDSVFVPVVLRASDAAHAARIGSPERAERLKHTHAESAQHKRRTTELLRIDHPNRLDIDTTHLPPSEAARLIIEHAERLA